MSALRGGYSLHFGKQLLSYVTYASTSIAMTNKINMYLSTGTIFTDHSSVTFHMHGEDKKALLDMVDEMDLFDFKLNTDASWKPTESSNAHCRRGHPLDSVDSVEALKLVTAAWGVCADLGDEDLATCDECHKAETFTTTTATATTTTTIETEDGKMRVCRPCKYRMCCSCFSSQVSISEEPVKANAVEACQCFGPHVMRMRLLETKAREQIVEQLIADAKAFCVKWKASTNDVRRIIP